MNTQTIKRPHHIGTHFLCELLNCRGDLNSATLARKVLIEAVKKSGATLITVKIHKFKPYGLTGFALLAESHISVHTWPEYKFAAVDIFTCGSNMKPEMAVDVFRGAYGPERTEVSKRKRGTKEMFEVEGKWFSDAVLPGGIYAKQRKGLIKIKKEIFSAKSSFQNIRVLDLYGFGRTLVLDDILQASEKDEFVYHEMIVHPAMGLIKNPENVMIIGGGDGGTVREILKYPTVKKIYMAELDKEVVRVSAKYLPFINKGSFDNPKLEIHFEDGVKAIQRFNDFFDLIIVDSSDPVGPSKKLFSKPFYLAAKKALRENGIISLHAGMSSPIDTKTIKDTVALLRQLYPYVEVRAAHVPSYFGVMNFVLACKNRQEGRGQLPSGELRYYTPEVGEASKVLPAYLQKII